MATLVCFHAHPDDEAIATGGTMLRAAEQGHRVVLVAATRGELGEVADGFLDPGETLGERRMVELADAARILGAAQVEWLGYHDSGMAGLPTNDEPGSFWTADVEEAADRLAAILRAHDADVLTVYDERGVYGHPDHIQVHRVGVRAAELAGVQHVYESTVDRDAMVALFEAEAEAGIDEAGQDADGDAAPEVPTIEDLRELGVASHLITTRVDVRPWIDRKRAAMRAHRSQIAEDSFFLAMDDGRFADVFGTECFIRRGAPTGTAEDWLAGL